MVLTIIVYKNKEEKDYYGDFFFFAYVRKSNFIKSNKKRPGKKEL